MKKGLANWLVIRVTGLLLAVLVLAHFAYTHIIYDIAETDAAFIAANMRTPFFLVWDWLILTLALLHGCGGIWVVAGEYSQSRRSFFRFLLIMIALLIFSIGTNNLI